jgi:hypothetical protein
LKLEKKFLSNTGNLTVFPPRGIKNQHPVEYIGAVDIKVEADENKMISAASDGVKLIATLAVAFVFATKGLGNLDLVGIFGTDPILVHRIEVSEGVRRPNEYMGWKVPWQSFLEDDIDQCCGQVRIDAGAI